MNALHDSYKRPHTYLRIAVTERCNLRCQYCMPEQGIDLQASSAILSDDEIVTAAKIFASMGVNKIRITGGEPLVRKNLPDLIRRLHDIAGITTIGLTTNGVLLQKYAAALKSAGLNALNISLDSLKPELFNIIARRDSYDDVFAGIQAAQSEGFAPLKINTVVIRGVNDSELMDFVEFADKYSCNVRFIEYMPFDSNGWSENGFLSYTDILRNIQQHVTLYPVLKSTNAQVAKDYQISGSKGTVSFITSMSEHFCDSCNRVRLTADGCVKACLFSSSEYSLRETLRSGDLHAAEEIIRMALQGKEYAHLPMNELKDAHNRSMIRIGG
jgi:molybdenum cofactor biosynthesis protein A